jgi:hypothetical protein
MVNNKQQQELRAAVMVQTLLFINMKINKAESSLYLTEEE